MKHIIILYSGGLDSLIMKKLSERDYPDARVTGLFFNHGQDSLDAELQSLPYWVIVKRMDWLGNDIKPVAKKSDPFAGAIYIPGRNLVFCVLAACYYQPDEIWLGVLADENNDQATDKNDKFVSLTEDALNYVLSPFKDSVKIVFPLSDRGWTKTDAIKSLMDSGHLSEEEIKATTSCWFNNGKPCGECKQCLKRALVLRNFGIVENHAGTHPLFPDNTFGQNLMNQYMECSNPNEDEKAMQRLIVAFRQDKKYWEVL